MSANLIGRRLRIRGRVQGVGYRDWAMRLARSMDLSGWIRNRSDGSVEAVVSGDAGAVERFIDRCRQGPPGARIDALDQSTDGESADASGFAILPTL